MLDISFFIFDVLFESTSTVYSDQDPLWLKNMLTTGMLQVNRIKIGQECTA